MKIDDVSDADLSEFAGLILERVHREVGYTVAGVHMVLSTYAKTRPADLRTCLRVIAEECQ